MPAFLEPYTVSIWALAATSILTVLQLLVADLARIRAKITPGAPIAADHSLFAFRADRAHANSVENLSAFALVAILAVLTGATPAVVNAAVAGYVAARALHMLLYYADIRPLRSVAFGAGVVATLTVAGALVARLA